MAIYTAEVEWLRGEQDFASMRYSRRHTLRFDGGAELAGSSSPHVVPLPLSDAAAVDPEEMFVAALASCHMLFFLSIAAARGHSVDRYLDSASGVMAKRPDGRVAMSQVTLRPAVVFGQGAPQPDHAEVAAMHHQAHVQCYIANSVTTEVVCEPVIDTPPGR
jgi:organic hydroperoxide reductase OsmC/OhrA